MENPRAQQLPKYMTQYVQMTEARQPLYAYNIPPQPSPQMYPSPHAGFLRAPSDAVPINVLPPRQDFVPQQHPQQRPSVQQPQFYSPNVPASHQPIFIQQSVPQSPQAYFPQYRRSVSSEQLKATEVKWAKVVKISSWLMTVIGVVCTCAILSRIAQHPEHEAEHVGPYFHLILAFLIFTTGVKGLRTARLGTVKSAKCYLASVSIISLLLVGSFVLGFAMAANHIQPNDIKFHEKQDRPDGRYVARPEPTIVAEHNVLLVEGSILAANVQEPNGHSSPDHKPRTSTSSHGDQRQKHSKILPPPTKKEGYKGYERTGEHQKHHSNTMANGHSRHPRPECFLMGGLIASVVCSFYIISAAKLLKARKEIDKLAHQPTVVMVAAQPQYQAQAMPMYAVYPSHTVAQA